VLTDLQHPTPIGFATSYWRQRGIGAEWLVGVRLVDGPGGTEFEVSADHRGAGLWTRFADRVQTWLQETRVAWGQARPPCPGHTHPAQPGEEYGVASWYCPADHQRIARIGEYQ
jgi:hypothetical protein